MDSKIIELLSEEIRETKNLTLQIKRQVDISESKLDIAERKAIASERKADAAWEVVIMTREEIKARREMSFWERLFG